MTFKAMLTIGVAINNAFALVVSPMIASNHCHRMVFLINMTNSRKVNHISQLNIGDNKVYESSSYLQSYL